MDRCLLCRLDELADPGSKGCQADIGDSVQEVFIVRKNNRVYGYINSCPHTGGPLDWLPDQFLSADKQHIQCATHDARFRINDGVCVAGPCNGDRLTVVSLQTENGDVFLLTGRLTGAGSKSFGQS